MKLKLDSSGNLFILESRYEERDVPKRAGFQWNPTRKCWWTADAAKAAQLVRYADDAAKAKLDAAKAKAEAAVEASRATDADIEIPAPAGLDYLPFQRAGIAYAQSRRATLIADEMGLGKTIQALGLVNADESIASVLVICPASLKLNWQREAQKWLVRGQRVEVVNGSEALPEAEVLILNYDVLRKHPALKERTFDLLVLDEAHYVKNQKAQRTKAVAAIARNCKRRVLLTGTPIANRPVELWSLLQVLDPAKYPASGFFPYAKRYCAAFKSRWGWDFSGASHLDELQRTLRETVMVRRLKKDVLTELPPKRRQVIELPANGLARVVEKEQRAEARWAEEINRLKAERDFASANADEAAYEAAIARLREARQAEFTELSRLRHEGAIAKLPKVVDHCLELLEAVDKLIIFAHHHDVVAGLMDELKDFNPVRLTGEDSQAARDAAVQSFQNDPTTRVFVGSIQAAGVGLTLTAASTVVFAELDWVPGNMSQAEDRLHRIGQNDAVLVQHVVLDGSLDAKLAKTLVRKQAILDAALDKQQTAAVMAEDEDEDEIEDADKSTPTLSLSNDEIVAIHADLRTLAAACDGAHARDGAGFNKVDARFGKSLARQERLTQKQAQFAARLLRKYRRQLIGGGA